MRNRDRAPANATSVSGRQNHRKDIPSESASDLFRAKRRDYMVFSWEYWRQIDYFGLNQSEPSWFVSLLTKLTQLSSMSRQEFLASGRMRDVWRYHEINWSQTNIPIQQSDLDWIPAGYFAGDTPFVQFQVSQSLGRVMGFWDERNVFNIVLLDPLHNLQPTKNYGYSIRRCEALRCDYSSLRSQLDGLLERVTCGKEECEFRKELIVMALPDPLPHAVVVGVSEETRQKIERHMNSGLGASLSELLKIGVDTL